MAIPPEYVSHSQLDQYLRCGKQYQLERLVKYPMPPTWYFIGGTAVHLATARLDQEPMDSWTPDRCEFLWSQAYNEGIQEAYEYWPEDSQWLKAGRVSRNNKDGQGYRYWGARGRDAVVGYAEWRMAHREEYQLAEIEYEFTVELGSHKLKGYIDRVFDWDHKARGYVVMDLKNATKRPSSPYQLALYRHGWETTHKGNARVRQAGWYMCKDNQFFPERIDHLTPSVLGGIFDKYLAGLEAEVFLPRIGDDCFGCPARPACGAKSGPTKEALQYDPLMKGTKVNDASGDRGDQASATTNTEDPRRAEGDGGGDPLGVGAGAPEHDA